jgi:hypothetical protein
MANGDEFAAFRCQSMDARQKLETPALVRIFEHKWLENRASARV